MFSKSRKQSNDTGRKPLYAILGMAVVAAVGIAGLQIQAANAAWPDPNSDADGERAIGSIFNPPKNTTDKEICNGTYNICYPNPNYAPPRTTYGQDKAEQNKNRKPAPSCTYGKNSLGHCNPKPKAKAPSKPKPIKRDPSGASGGVPVRKTLPSSGTTRQPAKTAASPAPVVKTEYQKQADQLKSICTAASAKGVTATQKQTYATQYKALNDKMSPKPSGYCTALRGVVAPATPAAKNPTPAPTKTPVTPATKTPTPASTNNPTPASRATAPKLTADDLAKSKTPEYQKQVAELRKICTAASAKGVTAEQKKTYAAQYKKLNDSMKPKPSGYCTALRATATAKTNTQQSAIHLATKARQGAATNENVQHYNVSSPIEGAPQSTTTGDATNPVTGEPYTIDAYATDGTYLVIAGTGFNVNDEVTLTATLGDTAVEVTDFTIDSEGRLFAIVTIPDDSTASFASVEATVGDAAVSVEIPLKWYSDDSIPSLNGGIDIQGL